MKRRSLLYKRGQVAVEYILIVAVLVGVFLAAQEVPWFVQFERDALDAIKNIYDDVAIIVKLPIP